MLCKLARITARKDLGRINYWKSAAGGVWGGEGEKIFRNPPLSPLPPRTYLLLNKVPVSNFILFNKSL